MKERGHCHSRKQNPYLFACLTVVIVMQGFLDLFILALIDVGDQKLVIGVMCIFLFAMDYPQESEIGEMTTLTVMGCVRVCVWVCGCVCVCVCVYHSAVAFTPVVVE